MARGERLTNGRIPQSAQQGSMWRYHNGEIYEACGASRHFTDEHQEFVHVRSIKDKGVTWAVPYRYFWNETEGKPNFEKIGAVFR